MIPRIRAVVGPRILVPEVVGCCMLLLVGVEDGGLAAVESNRLVEAVGVMGLVMVVVCIQCKEGVVVVVLYKWGQAGKAVGEMVEGVVVARVVVAMVEGAGVSKRVVEATVEAGEVSKRVVEAMVAVEGTVTVGYKQAETG
ncbi:hypothetical protein HanPSC8_Chr12g0503921 [Helianthus annuus]|nr:hypothetical protein HanPSC8_Chr12g0503921 [Helianthus annuus]